MVFLKIFRDFINYHSTTFVLYDKRKQKTIDGYFVRYNSISSFLLSKNLIKLKAKDFTIRIANEYFSELSSKHGNNYSARNVEVCKMVLEYATRNELIKYNPLNSFRAKKTMPLKPVYLTPNELILFENYIPGNPMLLKAKQMFLFQCYTGMDYGDITNVSLDNIIVYKDREYIIKKRLKTGIEAFIPYSEKAKVILSIHGRMNLLSNQKYNQSLKIIGIDLKLNKDITSHIGRKTFAMTKLNYESYSIEAVSKILGHKSIKTTESYYAQVEIDLISRELDKLGI